MWKDETNGPRKGWASKKKKKKGGGDAEKVRRDSGLGAKKCQGSLGYRRTT